MDTIATMKNSMQNNQFIEFLCGLNGYEIESSQYTPGIVPTNTEKIILLIYEEYLVNQNIKTELEESLNKMINQNALQLYIALIYFMDILFSEDHGLSSFKINKDRIITELKKAIKLRKSELKKDMEFGNGLIKKNPWNDIIRWDKVCQLKYKLSFLE